MVYIRVDQKHDELKENRINYSFAIGNFAGMILAFWEASQNFEWMSGKSLLASLEFGYV